METFTIDDDIQEFKESNDRQPRQATGNNLWKPLFKADEFAEQFEQSTLEDHMMTRAQMAQFGVIISGKRAKIQAKIMEVVKKNAF